MGQYQRGLELVLYVGEVAINGQYRLCSRLKTGHLNVPIKGTFHLFFTMDDSELQHA